MSRVVELHDEAEWAAAIKETKGFGGKALVVDFSASWCGPCKAISPVFEQLSSKYPTIKFVKIDVDELQDVAAQCGVRAMPTFQAFFNGEKVDEMVGADPRQLQALIDKVAAMQPSTGAGMKVGGGEGSAAAPAMGDDLRARMAAAAEARFKAQQQAAGKQ